MDSHDDAFDSQAGTWAVFGDLMAGMLGAFVLVLVFVLGSQLELVERLNSEVQQRQAIEQRRQGLERALAEPLAAGRVTLDNGRIGISGGLLFALSSAELQPEGHQLLKSLVPILKAHLAERRELLMVCGFTDDRSVLEGRAPFADNLELSAQRALTVTRALIDQGLPADWVFAAAFGQQQPVASNADASGRARNRRVEMAPVARERGAHGGSRP